MSESEDDPREEQSQESSDKENEEDMDSKGEKKKRNAKNLGLRVDTRKKAQQL